MCTLLSHSIATRHKVPYKPATLVKLIAANEERLNVEGEAHLYMHLKGIRRKIRKVISKDMKEDMLISRTDLKTFKGIPE